MHCFANTICGGCAVSVRLFSPIFIASRPPSVKYAFAFTPNGMHPFIIYRFVFIVGVVIVIDIEVIGRRGDDEFDIVIGDAF